MTRLTPFSGAMILIRTAIGSKESDALALSGKKKYFVSELSRRRPGGLDFRQKW
jgi:hypothetical protein